MRSSVRDSLPPPTPPPPPPTLPLPPPTPTLPPPTLRGTAYLITWQAEGVLTRLFRRVRGGGLGHTALYIEPTDGYPGMYISYTQRTEAAPEGLCYHHWDFTTWSGAPFSVQPIHDLQIRPMMETALARAAVPYSGLEHNCSTVAQEILAAGFPPEVEFARAGRVATPEGLLGRVREAETRRFTAKARGVSAEAKRISAEAIAIATAARRSSAVPESIFAEAERLSDQSIRIAVEAEGIRQRGLAAAIPSTDREALRTALPTEFFIAPHELRVVVPARDAEGVFHFAASDLEGVSTEAVIEGRSERDREPVLSLGERLPSPAVTAARPVAMAPASSAYRHLMPYRSTMPVATPHTRIQAASRGVRGSLTALDERVRAEASKRMERRGEVAHSTYERSAFGRGAEGEGGAARDGVDRFGEHI